MSNHPIPTRRNLLIIAVQLAATAALFLGARAATAWWEILGLATLFAVVGNSIYSIIHEAEHGLLHPDRRVNELLGAGMALLFPAPYHLIRQGHIGHHMRNRSDDEAFDFYFDGEKRFLKWVQLYGILTGFYWAAVVLSNLVVLVAPSLLQRKYFEFDRPSAAFMESLNADDERKIRLEALLVMATHMAIILGLGIPWLNYLMVYLGFGISWSAMQYVHHFGTVRDAREGSRNLWLLAPLDLILLHHNWHRTHHRNPTVPWVHLPRLSQAEGAQREFLLRHYLKMWRGPRYTDHHVENRYAGRIVR